MAAVLAVTEPGDQVGWLITELRRRHVVVIDRRHPEPRYLQFDEGLLIAPFETNATMIAKLTRVHGGWRQWMAVVKPGAERVEKLLA